MIKTIFHTWQKISPKPLINLLLEIAAECDKMDKSVNIKEKVDRALEGADVEYLRNEIPSAISQSLMGIDRVKKIVKAMKDFSYIDSDEKQVADINKAIESTVMISRNEWKDAAEIETDIDPSLPQVPCFIGEINQVFMNFIVNSAHAISDVAGDNSRNKGLIKISTRSRKKSISITISDTGSGIPVEICDRIFDPFFTTKDVGKGTGQGLSLAYDIIVNKHNGKIAVDSKLGIGTTFKITLPITDKS